MDRSAMENITVIFAFLAGIIIVLFSLYSLYVDYVYNSPAEYMLLDFVFLIIGSVVVGGSLKLKNKLIGYRTAAIKTFDEVVYERLRPLMEELAYGIVEVNEMKSKIDSIEKSLLEIKTTTSKYPETTLQEAMVLKATTFYIKSIFVTIFFFGAYLFFLQFSIPYEEYLYTLLYVIWWIFITKEFQVHTRTEAWIVLGIPIILVPSGSIILRALLGLVPLMGTIFITVVLYAYFYYRYAKHLAQEMTLMTNGIKRGNFAVEIIKEFAAELRKLIKNN